MNRTTDDDRIQYNRYPSLAVRCLSAKDTCLSVHPLGTSLPFPPVQGVVIMVSSRTDGKTEILGKLVGLFQLSFIFDKSERTYVYLYFNVLLRELWLPTLTRLSSPLVVAHHMACLLFM